MTISSYQISEVLGRDGIYQLISKIWGAYSNHFPKWTRVAMTQALMGYLHTARQASG